MMERFGRMARRSGMRFEPAVTAEPLAEATGVRTLYSSRSAPPRVSLSFGKGPPPSRNIGQGGDRRRE